MANRKALTEDQIKEYTDKMIRLTGKQYLMVKDRLPLLRIISPDAQIWTENLYDGEWGTNAKGPVYRAAFKATIVFPDGTYSNGHGSETSSDFGDYYEKAETKAIGRAIYAAGIGLQFPSPDFEYEEDNPKKFKGVDTPVEPASVGTETASRADLLAEVNREKERISAAKMGEFVKNVLGKDRLSALSDDELKQVLTFSKAQL